MLREIGFVFWEEIVRWEEGRAGGGWRERERRRRKREDDFGAHIDDDVEK